MELKALCLLAFPHFYNESDNNQPFLFKIYRLQLRFFLIVQSMCVQS